MKTKKSQRFFIPTLIAAVAAVPLFLTACTNMTDNSDKWKTSFDISFPDFANAGNSAEYANAGGWYETLIEDFDGGLGDVFNPEQHYKRDVEYWCDHQVSVQDGKVAINAEYRTDYECESCPKEGYFTGGITTSEFVDGVRVPTFEQAFGYFEARVKFPNSDGMWSAFWLQCASMRQIGNDGRDGSEIDIYESSFWNNRTKVGHCIHWDGYAENHRSGGTTRDAGYDLYEGYHTFGLKWTPTEYVFYVDGIANWASDFGGVSRVPEYIKLTNEIRPGAWGPYAQKLGKFDGGVFLIESVKVYQNVNYLSEIRSASDFQ